MLIRQIEFWLAEPVFFASRELSDSYLTEGVLGNYALAYALGWAQSPYRLAGQDVYRPRYREDLGTLSGYILPAWPRETPRYRFERFNALSDAYWFMMTNNRVATAREYLPSLASKAAKPGEFRPSNYPQSGRIRFLERDQYFDSLVLGTGELPTYIRLGKFNSKVRVCEVQRWQAQARPSGTYFFKGTLNPADLPAQVQVQRYDLLNIPPVPLLQRVHFEGPAWQAGEWLIPQNMHLTGISKR